MGAATRRRPRAALTLGLPFCDNTLLRQRDLHQNRRHGRRSKLGPVEVASFPHSSGSLATLSAIRHGNGLSIVLSFSDASRIKSALWCLYGRHARRHLLPAMSSSRLYPKAHADALTRMFVVRYSCAVRGRQKTRCWTGCLRAGPDVQPATTRLWPPREQPRRARTIKQASCSSTEHGGGKRRGIDQRLARMPVKGARRPGREASMSRNDIRAIAARDCGSGSMSRRLNDIGTVSPWSYVSGPLSRNDIRAIAARDCVSGRPARLCKVSLSRACEGQHGCC